MEVCKEPVKAIPSQIFKCILIESINVREKHFGYKEKSHFDK